MEFHSVKNWKENCHHDHIALNLKGNEYFFLQRERLKLRPIVTRSREPKRSFEQIRGPLISRTNITSSPTPWQQSEPFQGMERPVFFLEWKDLFPYWE